MNYSILIGPPCPLWNWVIVTYPAIIIIMIYLQQLIYRAYILYKKYIIVALVLGRVYLL